MRCLCVHPGSPVSPLGHGQHARTTGGAGMLPAANPHLSSRLSISSLTLLSSSATSFTGCCNRLFQQPSPPQANYYQSKSNPSSQADHSRVVAGTLRQGFGPVFHCSGGGADQRRRAGHPADGRRDVRGRWLGCLFQWHADHRTAPGSSGWDPGAVSRHGQRAGECDGAGWRLALSGW